MRISHVQAHPFFIAPLALLIGCSGNVQNPVDRITYRDEPLVRDVETGMTQARVLSIGGEPSRATARTVVPGLVTTTSSTGTASSSPITSVSTVPAGWMARVS